MTRTAIFPRAGRDGFTLIELLIVIVIMAILATMFVPVINKALQSADNARSKSFVQEVAGACKQFKGEHDAKYPGQDDLGILKGSDDGSYTGSQILASRLFGYPETEISMASPNAKSKYLGYKLSRLISKSSKGVAIAANSLGDESSTVNALLYFPSRLNKIAPTDCYKWADSSEYVSQAGAQTVFTADCITDQRTNIARDPGGMLIIGTGGNDMYLEQGAGNDDIRSWEIK